MRPQVVLLVLQVASGEASFESCVTAAQCVTLVPLTRASMSQGLSVASTWMLCMTACMRLWVQDGRSCAWGT